MKQETTLDNLKTEVIALKKRLSSLESTLIEEKKTTTQLRTDLDRQIQTNINNMRNVATLFKELHKTGKITDHLVIT